MTHLSMPSAQCIPHGVLESWKEPPTCCGTYRHLAIDTLTAASAESLGAAAFQLRCGPDRALAESDR